VRHGDVGGDAIAAKFRPGGDALVKLRAPQPKFARPDIRIGPSGAFRL
jgi:hypothetical protein